MERKFKCPLCESVLTESKYYEIVGIWEAKKKYEEELKEKIENVKNERLKLIKEKEGLRRRFEIKFKKQRELLIKKAKKEGIELQKKRFESVNKLLQTKIKDIELKDKQIKELKEQLKKGTTPQLDGFKFEEQLVKELKSKFPVDKIKLRGKAGDIWHYVICECKEIALIIYECKKTQYFNKSYVTKLKSKVVKHNANYGVLVSHAQYKKNKKKSQFWVEKDILIVHPYGAPYIAEVLRKSLIQLYSLKLRDKELNERAKKLLEYIKSNKFRNSVKDNIIRAKELYELLNKGIEYHKTIWGKRHEHYTIIANQLQEIEEDSKKIVGEDFGTETTPNIPQVTIKPKKKRKILQPIE